MPALHDYGDGLSQRAYALAAELARRGHTIDFCAPANRVFVSGGAVRGFPIQRLVVAPETRPRHWCLQAAGRAQAARRLVATLSRSHELFISCQAEVVSAYAGMRKNTPVVFVSGSSTLLFDGADRADQREESVIRRVCFAVDRCLKHRNESAAYRRANSVVFDSCHTRDHVRSTYRLSGENLHAIIGGVDPNEFAPPAPEQRIAARKRLGLSEDSIVVMGSGRLVERKGFALLVSALAALERTMTGVLVGDGPARPELEALARNSNRAIVFPGMTADMQLYLHAADIYAFTSICESFGGALVEAMACGLPCIGIRPDGKRIVNANLEIMEDGLTGVLCEDAESSLAAAISTLAADCDLRRRLGRAARQRVCDRFTWTRAGAAMSMLIDSIQTPMDVLRPGLALQG